MPGNNLLWQSLHNRLEDLQKASEMSRDLLLLAGDSLRDQSASLPVRPPPASAEVQTEETDTNNETTQTEETVEVSHSACPTERCFCSKAQATQAPTRSRIRSFFRGVFIMVVLCFIFTFFCGLKIDQDTYYPVTWHSLRSAHILLSSGILNLY